jgi:hypothetical protein
MKPLILIFLLSLSVFANSQIKSIHLVKHEASINPLFSKVSRKINFVLDKVSIIDSPKSIIFFKIDIYDRKSELVGSAGSLGMGGNMIGYGGSGVIGGLLGSSFNSTKQYLYKNTTGTIILNKQQFDTLYTYFGKIKELIKSNSDEPKLYDISYNFNVDQLEINLEFVRKFNETGDSFNQDITNKVSIDKNVYLKIDESIFGFKESEFLKLTDELFPNIKNNWKTK